MHSWLDLHMHSCFSPDGFFTPEQLAELCARAGLRVAALCDHNSVGGSVRMEAAAKQYGLEVLPAIELDTQIDQRLLHILGYGIEPRDPIWKAHEEETRAMERAMAAQMLDRVHALGIAFDDATVYAMAKAGPVEAIMIAEVALCDPRNDKNPLLFPYRPGGARSDNAYLNFYWDFCGPGAPAYVYVPYIRYDAAARLIRDGGGVPILAHPGQNFGCDEVMLQTILAAGVMGVETDCSYHDGEAAAFYRQRADQLGILRTMGSDFHGRSKPAVRLGELPPDGQDKIYRELKRAMALASGRRPC